MFLVVSGAIGTSIETVFGSPVRFTCPEGPVFATGVEVIDTVCMPGGKWSQSYIPKCQEVMTSTKIMNRCTVHNVASFESKSIWDPLKKDFQKDFPTMNQKSKPTSK